MGEGEGRRKQKQEQARISPMRSRILELYERDHDRSLAPADLMGELTANFGKNVTETQIVYHLRWLRDADLIPAEDES